MLLTLLLEHYYDVCSQLTMQKSKPPEVFCKKRDSLKFRKFLFNTKLQALSLQKPQSFEKFLRISILRNICERLLLSVCDTCDF